MQLNGMIDAVRTGKLSLSFVDLGGGTYTNEITNEIESTPAIC